MFSISSIAFLIFLASISFLAFKRFRRIYLNIQLGTAWTPSNSALDRLKNMVLIALGQKKMFSRPIPAIFHFFIYLAFIFTQIELFEIIIDGIFDTHRFMGHVFQNLNIEFLYIGLINFIEILSLLALIATFVFLSRRNLLKLPRFTMS